MRKNMGTHKSTVEVEDVEVEGAGYCITGVITYVDAKFEEGLPTDWDVSTEITAVARYNDAKQDWDDLADEALAEVLAKHGELFKKILVQQAEDDAVSYAEACAER